MNRVTSKQSLPMLVLLASVCHIPSIQADERAEIQKQLNEQVLGKSFNVENDANLDAYIQEATKRGTPPRTEPSKYWRKGYTCADLRRYSWTDYRDCSYYHSYYGYYWPY